MTTRHERLTELFTEALDLADPERAALIERVRAEDASLADELAALLAVDEKAALATGGLSPAMQGNGDLLFDVPGYRVESIIGEGAMGTVYAAEQEQPRRRVAIKVLFARAPSALARFKAEARIMARLDHPGIARVLEAGDANGSPFLVMEHVAGETLDVHAKQRTRAERIALFLAICDAVQHAHVKGVIHRDLKPANVMVRADGRVVVLDFGVARLAADDGSSPGDTRAGELVGTPLYMSPEQAQGHADAVDARSDVYTLGVILYELLCGELPYEVRDLPLGVVTSVISEDPPVPLAKRDSALAGDLDAIVQKALAKEPGERYASVAALADDVRRFVAGLPVSVRVPGVVERTRRYVRRRPFAAAAIAGAVVATLAFAGVVTALWLEARSARRTAEAARVDTEAARGVLEVRANQLVLGTAREALARDPTEALAWLATLTGNQAAKSGIDAGVAWAIFDEAVARGVAANVLVGHADEVHWNEPIAGGGFVTGSYDGHAMLWEPPRFSPRLLFMAKRGRVHAARPSPDGRLVAVGCDDGEAAVVARDGSVIARLSGMAGDVQHLAWSPDGAWLATGDDHGNTWLWPHGSAPGRRLTESHSAIGDVAFADDGSALAASDHDGHVWLWSTATWTARTADLGGDPVTAWTDGGKLAIVDGEGAVHRWHVAGDALVADGVTATGRKVKRAVFAKGGAWVALGGVGGEVTRVEGEAIEVLEAPHATLVRSLAISDDGNWIADGGEDGSLVLRDRAHGRMMMLRGHVGRIRHLEFGHAPDGDVLVSSDSQGVIRRWRLAAQGGALIGAGAAIERFATDGAHLAAADVKGDVWLWTLGDGQRRRVGHSDGRVTVIEIVGGNVVTGTAEGDVSWWTAAPVHAHVKGSITAFATAGDRLAVASSTGRIAMFLATGEPVGELYGNSDGTNALAFAPDGARIASGGQDRRVLMQHRDNLAGGPPAGTDGKVDADVHFLAFTPGGDRLIAASNDGVVRAWQASGDRLGTGQVLARHTGAVTALAIDPSGRFLVTAGRDRSVIRTPLWRGGDTQRTFTLTSAATALAIGADGTIHAVTGSGTVERVGSDDPHAVVESDHAKLGLQIDARRWAVAKDDGTVILFDLTARPLAALPSAIRAATGAAR